MLADMATVVYGNGMSKEFSVEFDQQTSEDVIFFDVLERLELAAQSEAGSSWPNRDNAKFSIKKEIVGQLPCKLPNGVEGHPTIDTCTYWFSGQSNYNKALLTQLTSYQVGFRVDGPTAIEEIPDHHVHRVFEYFKSIDAKANYAAAEKTADLSESYFDTVEEDEAEYDFDVPFMRDVMQDIVEVEKQAVAAWESIAYEVDEAQLLIALIMKRGCSIGDGEIVISEYTSYNSSCSPFYAHEPKMDGLKTEVVALAVNGEVKPEIQPDSFDADTLLFDIDFREIARKNVAEDDILAEPRYVYASYVLGLLKRFKQPYKEFDKE